MARAMIGSAIRDVGVLFESGSRTGLSEGELLERFLARKDEAAFEALVRRHGPMVQAVCRRLLRDPHAADDAFQATFLVLVRKASGLRRPELLGPWLYGVAYRVASKARVASARRRRHEAGAALEVGLYAEDASMGVDSSVDSTLFDEVRRLPEKYRNPIVLCYLEGRTHEEAAAALRWPLGTVKGRLARARDLLQSRLSRRGVTVPSAAVGGLLAAESARASVSPALVSSTVQAAVALAAGQALAAGAVSATALSLANGASRTMLFTKLITTGAAVALTGGAVALAPHWQGGGVAVGGGPSQAGGGGGAAVVPGGDGGQEEYVKAAGGAGGVAPSGGAPGTSGEEPPKSLEDYLQARVEVARRGEETQRTFFEIGTINIDRYLSASRALMVAEFQVAADHEAQETAIGTHLNRLEKLVKEEVKKEEVGGGSGPNLAEVQQELADARVLLARFRQGDVSPELQVSMGGSGALRGRAGAMSAMMGGGGEGAGGSASGGMGMPGMMGGRGMMGSGGGAEVMMMGGMAGAMGMGGGAMEGGGDQDEFKSDGSDEASVKIRSILNSRRLSMPFENETPLGDILEYLKQATATDEMKNGLPFYVDPVGLTQIELTEQSPVRVNLDGVPLRTTLWLTLRQVGLAYAVIDGLVVISTPVELAKMLREGPMFEPDKVIIQGGGMGGMGGGGPFQ